MLRFPVAVSHLCEDRGIACWGPRLLPVLLSSEFFGRVAAPRSVKIASPSLDGDRGRLQGGWEGETTRRCPTAVAPVKALQAFTPPTEGILRGTTMSNELKLGDTIDDYCSRCRLLMNHYVVSLVDGVPQKVRCQTCSNEHNYRHGKGGKKKDTVKSLFDQVAASLPSPTRSTPRDKK